LKLKLKTYIKFLTFTNEFKGTLRFLIPNNKTFHANNLDHFIEIE
jgi:hypothetical protein